MCRGTWELPALSFASSQLLYWRLPHICFHQRTVMTFYKTHLMRELGGCIHGHKGLPYSRAFYSRGSSIFLSTSHSGKDHLIIHILGQDL